MSPPWRPAGWRPDEPDGVDPARAARAGAGGVLVERDGLWFHADAIDAGRRSSPPACWPTTPAGFTVGEFRDAAGITRKHAVPLLSELDAAASPAAATTGASPARGCRDPATLRAGRHADDQADSRSWRRSSW